MPGRVKCGPAYRTTREDAITWRREYAEGAGLKQIARRHRRSLSTIHLWVRRDPERMPTV